MKKRFDIEIDCANCALKVENKLKEIEGVNSVTVSYINQRMTIDIDDDKFDKVLKEAIKAAKKIEPDFEVKM